MSCSSSVSGSGILLYHSGSTTRWQVEQARVPSQAPEEGEGWEEDSGCGGGGEGEGVREGVREEDSGYGGGGEWI